MVRQAPILIAGGGICGLATAVALAGIGRHSHILERRAEYSEAGAGIQLGPNAVRILKRLGVDSAIESRSAAPEAIDIFDGATGDQLVQLPLGRWAERRYGAPYWVVLRSDLQCALQQTAHKHASIIFTNGFHVEDFEQDSNGVSAFDASRNRVVGSALVGADGIWSEVRDRCFEVAQPRFMGKSAYRAIVDRAAAPHALSSSNIGLWIGPGVHVEHYPVAAGAQISIVGMIDDVRQGADWGAPSNGQPLLKRVRGWAPVLQELLSQASEWHCWALHLGPRLGQWSTGRTTLAGDAAHSFFPFLSQGGGLAIESAFAIASALKSTPEDPEAAFRQYQSERIPRSRAVGRASRLIGQVYHLRGLASTIRNTALRRVSGEHLMKRLDWLYRYGRGGS